MHLLSLPSFPPPPLGVPRNATALNYTIELLPVRYTPMVDYRHATSQTAGNASLTSTRVLGSVVVLLQITLLLQGSVLTRAVKPFVLDHFREVSADYVRFTPLWERGVE